MHIGSTAFAIFNLDSEEAEDEEEAGHTEADSVDGRISNQLVARLPGLDTHAEVFKERDVSVHRIGYGWGHHDATNDCDEDEVERVHEACTGGLLDLGAAAAAQCACCCSAAAGELSHAALHRHAAGVQRNPGPLKTLRSLPTVQPRAPRAAGQAIPAASTAGSPSSPPTGGNQVLLDGLTSIDQAIRRLFNPRRSGVSRRSYCRAAGSPRQLG